jgi:hypothetical protein
VPMRVEPKSYFGKLTVCNMPSLLDPWHTMTVVAACCLTDTSYPGMQPTQQHEPCIVPS